MGCRVNFMQYHYEFILTYFITTSIKLTNIVDSIIFTVLAMESELI